MALNKRKADKKRKKVQSAAAWMESQARTDSTAVAVPKGTNIFKPDKQGTFRIEILPYDVKKGKDKPDRL